MHEYIYLFIEMYKIDLDSIATKCKKEYNLLFQSKPANKKKVKIMATI